MKRTIFIILLSVIIILQLLKITWFNTTLFTSTQPSDIEYNSFDPYILSIIKQQQTLTSKHIIFVGKEPGPTYGHTLNFPTSIIVSDMEIQELQVQWTQEGIQLETYYGTKLFIPKKNFTGGR